MQGLSGKDIGRYHIIEQLGEGGMAIVYKAYDTRLEREVALKVIRSEEFGPAALERLGKRFEREARVLAKFEHPNIVPIMDYGEYQGAPYLVMSYLTGGTLKDRTGKPWNYQAAARLLAPIADALAYAHREGVLHRDIKPANILINQKDAPVLSDFGIAKTLEEKGTTQITKKPPSDFDCPKSVYPFSRFLFFLSELLSVVQKNPLDTAA